MVNPAECEENRKLILAVSNAWEHYNRLKGRLPGENPDERQKELIEAGDSANRLSAEQNTHVKTCYVCRTQPK